MPNDFDENGNMRRAQSFPSGIEKIKQALGIVPPAMIYFVGSSQPGSILDALKTPNKDVDFASIVPTASSVSIMAEMAERHRLKLDEIVRCQMTAGASSFVVTNEQYAAYLKATPYTGPDMNEVDAALEAIERMEE